MRSFSSTFLACSLAIAGCPGSHTDLGQDTGTTTSGGGGSGGGGGAGASSSGGAPPILEPDGPPKLTVLNAIVDRPKMQLCFLESPPSASDGAEPWPDAPLSFARAEVGPPLPDGNDVEIVVLTGSLDSLGSAKCREIVDNPADFDTVEALSLGVATGADFDVGRSLLFAVNGCFGGAGHDDAELGACGPDYTADTPTPGVVIAPLSRLVAGDSIGFQFVHAAAGDTALDFAVRSSFDGTAEVVIATAAVPGEAAPFPPSFAFDPSALGTPENASTHTAVTGSLGLKNVGVVLVGTAMSAGGITSGAFANGQNVAFVGVGAMPGTPSGSWWKDFTVVALSTDP